MVLSQLLVATFSPIKIIYIYTKKVFLKILLIYNRKKYVTNIDDLPRCLSPSFPGPVLWLGHLNFMTKAVIRADM